MPESNEFTLNEAWALKKVKALCSSFKVNLTDDALDMWVEAILDIVGTNEEVKHSSFPKPVRPGEWLFRNALATMNRFPKPIQLRRMYCRYWPPADGNEPIGEEE